MSPRLRRSEQRASLLEPAIVAYVLMVLPSTGSEKRVMRIVSLPLLVSLENFGNGFRVGLVERDNGWERVIRSDWCLDLSSARARATELSVKNAYCPIREIGTERGGGSPARRSEET